MFAWYLTMFGWYLMTIRYLFRIPPFRGALLFGRGGRDKSVQTARQNSISDGRIHSNPRDFFLLFSGNFDF